MKEGEQKVKTLVGTLRIDEETISALLRTYISSVERLIKDFQNLKEEIKEGHKKLRRLERKFSMLHQYRREILLLKAGTPPFKRKGTLPEVTCAFTYVNMENTRGRGMENAQLP